MAAKLNHSECNRPTRGRAERTAGRIIHQGQVSLTHSSRLLIVKTEKRQWPSCPQPQGNLCSLGPLNPSCGRVRALSAKLSLSHSACLFVRMAKQWPPFQRGHSPGSAPSSPARGSAQPGSLQQEATDGFANPAGLSARVPCPSSLLATLPAYRRPRSQLHQSKTNTSSGWGLREFSGCTG